MSRPRASVVEYTPQVQYIVVHGIPERQECNDDISKMGNMKYAYRNREFWCTGYYVDTVGKNTQAIKEYIENQLKSDKEADQLSIFDPNDPFKGGK